MAMGKFLTTARKLQTACNERFGVHLLINQWQWFSKDKNRAITVYTVLHSIPDEENRKDINTVLFSTYSQVQLVLFLRDYWYELNGWEVPTDNEEWEAIKRQYAENKQYNKSQNNTGTNDTGIGQA